MSEHTEGIGGMKELITLPSGLWKAGTRILCNSGSPAIDNQGSFSKLVVSIAYVPWSTNSDAIRFRISPPAGGIASHPPANQVQKIITAPNVTNNFPLRETSFHRLSHGISPFVLNFHLNQPTYRLNKPISPNTPRVNDSSSHGPEGAQPTNRTSIMMMIPMPKKGHHVDAPRLMMSGGPSTSSYKGSKKRNGHSYGGLDIMRHARSVGTASRPQRSKDTK